jgi:hypothetical protein
MLPTPLLRSVIRCTPDDPEEALATNLVRLYHDALDLDGIDRDIVRFLADLHLRAKTVPQLAIARQHFEQLQAQGHGTGMVGVARLQTLEEVTEPALIGADFEFALDQYFETRLKEQMARLLVEAAQVLQVGIEQERVVKGARSTVRLHGPTDALTYVMDHVGLLRTRADRGRKEGSFRADSFLTMEEYLRVKADPTRSHGVRSGITMIDRHHTGLKRGELALVMGFPSHLKSTFCLNWAYHAAVWYKHNVAVVPLEMSVPTLRDLLVIMHSAHARFGGVINSIDYDKVEAGTLTEDEERFYQEVAEDFRTNPDYGQLFYLEATGALTMAQVQQWAEKLHARTPLDLIVIDYIGLMEPGPAVATPDPHHRLNAVIRQAKVMSMTFGQGHGIGVLSPFQANREGLKAAEKAGGRYTLTALAGANEAEKSSDIVYYTYLSSVHRERSELAFGNLKHRNKKIFTEQLLLRADASTRVIGDLPKAGPVTAETIDSMDGL